VSTYYTIPSGPCVMASTQRAGVNAARPSQLFPTVPPQARRSPRRLHPFSGCFTPRDDDGGRGAAAPSVIANAVKQSQGLPVHPPNAAPKSWCKRGNLSFSLPCHRKPGDRHVVYTPRDDSRGKAPPRQPRTSEALCPLRHGEHPKGGCKRSAAISGFLYRATAG